MNHGCVYSWKVAEAVQFKAKDKTQISSTNAWLLLLEEAPLMELSLVPEEHSLVTFPFLYAKYYHLQVLTKSTQDKDAVSLYIAISTISAMPTL